MLRAGSLLHKVTAELSLELLCVEFRAGTARSLVASTIIIILVVCTVKATSEIILLATKRSPWVLAGAALVTKV